MRTGMKSIGWLTRCRPSLAGVSGAITAVRLDISRGTVMLPARYRPVDRRLRAGDQTADRPRPADRLSEAEKGVKGVRGRLSAPVVQPLTTSVKVKETQGFLCRISESHFEATTYNSVSKLRHAASWGEVGEKCVGPDPRRHTSPLDPDHFQGRR